MYDTAGLRTTGALLYVYAAGTTTPAPAYVDPVYASAHPFPIGLRGNGTWPVIYLPAGSYSLRVTDLGGDVLDEIDLYRVEAESTDEADPATTDAFVYEMQVRPVEDRHGFRDYGHRHPARADPFPLLSIRTDDETGRLIVIESDRVADVTWLLPSSDMRRLCRGSHEARLSIVSGDEFAVIATFRFVVA